MTLSKSGNALKKFFIKTYGCQMNFYDSGIIESGLLKNGFNKANSIADADVVIINTCSVRDHAEHKIVSELGRLKKNAPGKKIVLAGCFAKQLKIKNRNDGQKAGFFGNINKPEKSGSLFFDYLFGPDEAPLIPDILRREAEKDGAGGCRGNGSERNYKDFGLSRKYFYDKETESRTAAVKITEGCDNYCSYCIVPYVRGRERSIPFEIICNAVRGEVLNGAENILLLGQNVNSYSSPEAGKDKKDFCRLINYLSEIDGIGKIKFLTSHPKDFSDGLIDIIRRNDKISKEIHLPVQAGSDKILYAMNRGYTAGDYLKLVEKLRNGRSDISLSTDIIVGFPGESEEDFKSTLSLLDEVKFNFIFGFKYSPRPFTKAFEILDDVSAEEKKERLERLFKKQKEIKSLYL